MPYWPRMPIDTTVSSGLSTTFTRPSSPVGPRFTVRYRKLMVQVPSASFIGVSGVRSPAGR